MNKIIINGYELPIKEYHEQRVVTFKDIDLVHGRPEGTASRNFKANRNHFIENEDYFIVKPSDFQKDEIRLSEINNRGTTLLTESGYLMLVKSFTDDLAWSVQRQLVNSYFRLKKQAKISLDVEEMKTRIKLSDQYLKLAKNQEIPRQYRDKLLEQSIEVLTGEKVSFPDIHEREVEENAKYILSRLKLKKIDEISFREIKRLCRKLKKSDDFLEPIALLIQNNYIIEIPTDYCGKGQRPSQKYKVIKA